MNFVKYNNKKLVPSKIICVGRNYVEHIKELNNEIPDKMVLFNKPNSAISDNLYYFSEHTRFESELCFLIESSKITAISFGLDLTHADIQNKMKTKGLPWERAKAFDGSAIFSDFVKLEDDVSSLRLELFVNKKLIQFASYDLMIYKPEQILKEIKTFMSLNDGDIIMSGTPKGVGTYKYGDIFIGKIFSNEKLLIQKNWTVI